MKILRPFAVLLSVYAAFAELPKTRGQLEQLTFWQILTGQYPTNLRPVRKALIVVDPQWCKFDVAGRDLMDVAWLKFINALLLGFQWNSVFYTGEFKQPQHISYTENLNNIEEGVHNLTYNKENGAICAGQVANDQAVFTDSCTDPAKTIKVLQQVSSRSFSCTVGSWDWQNVLGQGDAGQGVAFLPNVWIEPNATVVKRGTISHLDSTNIWENSFTQALRDQGEPELEPRVMKTIRNLPFETLADAAESADLFFVGSDVQIVEQSAREARRRGFKTVVLMDGIQRKYEDQAAVFATRRKLHENGIAVRQYVSDWAALGRPFFERQRKKYDVLFNQALTRFSFEFGATPNEFTEPPLGMYPLLWIVVGIFIGGVAIGILVTMYYMRKVNPKIELEQRNEGIQRTRSGE